MPAKQLRCCQHANCVALLSYAPQVLLPGFLLQTSADSSEAREMPTGDKEPCQGIPTLKKLHPCLMVSTPS